MGWGERHYSDSQNGGTMAQLKVPGYLPPKAFGATAAGPNRNTHQPIILKPSFSSIVFPMTGNQSQIVQAENTTISINKLGRHYSVGTWNPDPAFTDYFFSLKDGASLDFGSIQVTRKFNMIRVELIRKDGGIEIPIGITGKPIDEKHYQEIKGVDKFKHGDILPGHNFVLGWPETYVETDTRELLQINTSPSSDAYKFIVKARELRNNYSGRELVNRIIDYFNQQYSPYQGNGEGGAAMTWGVFAEEGGCCRHRASLLHYMFQEAGVRSRYVRGRVVGGGYHAWVDVSLSGGPIFSNVVDPNNQNNRTLVVKRHRKEIGANLYEAGGLLYSPEDLGATVWRLRS